MQAFLLISLIISAILCSGGIAWFIIDIISYKKDKGKIYAVKADTPLILTALKEESAKETLAILENEPIPEAIPTKITIDENENSVEVIDIVWKEDINKKKAYRYSPNGFEISEGDTVLVPTYISGKKCEVARKAFVCRGIYKIDPKELNYKLKPVLQLVKK